MANQLEKGRTFNPGDTVEAADLNLLVDGATALPGIILNQLPQVAAATNDRILIADASDSDALKRALISSLPGAGTVTTVGVTLTSEFGAVFAVSVVTPGTTPDIHFGFDTQTRRTFLGAPVAAGGMPSFRVLAPADLPTGTVDILATGIDWSLGTVFKKTLSTNTTFSFTNPTEGQTITVLVNQDASHTVTWPNGAGGVYWAGGTVHTMTSGAGRHDILVFRYIGGNYYGNYLLNFLSV